LQSDPYQSPWHARGSKEYRDFMATTDVIDDSGLLSVAVMLCAVLVPGLVLKLAGLF
jgi:hypothetical protein